MLTNVLVIVVGFVQSFFCVAAPSFHTPCYVLRATGSCMYLAGRFGAGKRLCTCRLCLLFPLRSIPAQHTRFCNVNSFCACCVPLVPVAEHSFHSHSTHNQICPTRSKATGSRAYPAGCFCPGNSLCTSCVPLPPWPRILSTLRKHMFHVQQSHSQLHVPNKTFLHRQQFLHFLMFHACFPVPTSRSLALGSANGLGLAGSFSKPKPHSWSV